MLSQAQVEADAVDEARELAERRALEWEAQARDAAKQVTTALAQKDEAMREAAREAATRREAAREAEAAEAARLSQAEEVERQLEEMRAQLTDAKEVVRREARAREAAEARAAAAEAAAALPAPPVPTPPRQQRRWAIASSSNLAVGGVGSHVHIVLGRPPPRRHHRAIIRAAVAASIGGVVVVVWTRRMGMGMEVVAWRRPPAGILPLLRTIQAGISTSGMGRCRQWPHRRRMRTRARKGVRRRRRRL